MVWNEADNFPLADRNPYVGHDAIVQGVFVRLAEQWDGFAAEVDELLDAGDTVVALGHYVGTCRATGKPIRAQPRPRLAPRGRQGEDLPAIYRHASGRAGDGRRLTGR